MPKTPPKTPKALAKSGAKAGLTGANPKAALNNISSYIDQLITTWERRCDSLEKKCRSAESEFKKISAAEQMSSEISKSPAGEDAKLQKSRELIDDLQKKINRASNILQATKAAGGRAKAAVELVMRRLNQYLESDSDIERGHLLTDFETLIGAASDVNLTRGVKDQLDKLKKNLKNLRDRAQILEKIVALDHIVRTVGSAYPATPQMPQPGAIQSSPLDFSDRKHTIEQANTNTTAPRTGSATARSSTKSATA